MLVQPDHAHRGQPQNCPENSAQPLQPTSGLATSASSVKLRRKNRESSLVEADKKRNRYSGGDFLLGSPARGHNMRNSQAAQPQVTGTGHSSHPGDQQKPDLMRKSGDWSYVSFPSSKSPPVTPKLNPKRPLSLMQHQQPISLLETKVMASIIHNETKRGQKSLEGSPQRLNGHHHSSAHATPISKPRSKSKTECSSLEKRRLSQHGSGKCGDQQNDLETSSSEEYTKMLRRRMISEVLHQSSNKPTVQTQSQNNNDIWQMKGGHDNNERPTRKTSAEGQKSSGRRGSGSSHHRRSHSAQGNNRSKSETQSEVNNSAALPVPVKNNNSSNGGSDKNGKNNNASVSPQKPGLGRRSATQLELSRRKRNEDSDYVAPIQKTKWHSQEHLDKVTSPSNSGVNGPGVIGGGVAGVLQCGNFAGGRKELAMRLLSMQTSPHNSSCNGTEEETTKTVHSSHQEGQKGDLEINDVDELLDDDDEADLDDIQRNHRYANMPTSLLAGLNGIGNHEDGGSSAIQLKKGILWQQRDKIFSRWKEKFFVLTKDYLQCFKKGSSRITEMGGFIYGIRLTEIVEVQLLDKRGYLTICLTLASKDGKLFLRKPEGIREWYQALKASAQASRDRRSMLSTEEFWSRKQFEPSPGNPSNPANPGTNIEQWLIARQRIDMKYNYGAGSPSSTWDREDNTGPKSLQPAADSGRRCRTPRSVPNSRPQSSTRSVSQTRPRRSISQHPNPSNLGVEHVYETPTKHEAAGVTSPSSSARSSRLSAGSNGFFRDSGNDTMYTSSGGSTDSSNRDQLHHRNQQHPARRHSEAKRISAPNLDNYSSASSTPKKSPYHRHLPSQATRV